MPVNDVEALGEDLFERLAFEARTAAEISRERRKHAGGRAQRVDFHSGVERKGRRLYTVAQQIERVGAMHDLNLMSSGGERVAKIGHENRVAPEALGREEGR